MKNINRFEWADHLTLNGFSVPHIYKSLLARVQKHQFQKVQEEILSRIYLVQSISKKVKNIVDRFPISTKQSTILKYLKQFQFPNINKKVLRSLLNYYHWPSQKDKLIFRYLRANGVFVRTKQRDNVILYTLICTKEMKENYQHYGECVSIDFEFVPLKRAKNLKSHYIGIFSGENENEEKRIFAIGIINSTQQKSYLELMNEFFHLFEKHPYTIVTSNNPIVQRSLQKLQKKFGFRIFINWFYKLKQYEKQFFQERKHDKIIDFLHVSMSTFSRDTHLKYYKKIMKKIEVKGNLLNIKKFFHHNHLFCLSICSPAFIGFSIQSDKVHELIRNIQDFFPFCDNLGNCLQESILMAELYQKQKKVARSCHEIENQEQVLKIKKILSPAIFQKFLFQYQEMKIISSDQLIKQSTVKIIVKLNEISYCLNYCVADGYWKCSCSYLIFSGLPCSHLLKVISEFQGSFQYYINSRWIVEDDAENN